MHLLTHMITDVKSARMIIPILRKLDALSKGDTGWHYEIEMPLANRDKLTIDVEKHTNMEMPRTYSAVGGPIVDNVLFVKPGYLKNART